MEIKKCVNCGKEISFDELDPDRFAHKKMIERWNNPEFRCHPCNMRKEYEDKYPDEIAKEKGFEERLEKIIETKYGNQAICKFLESKGYERIDLGFKRGVHVIIYKREVPDSEVKKYHDYYRALRPIPMLVLQVICALGTTTLYQIQKLLSPTYNISIYRIRDALRKLVKRDELVQKKVYRVYRDDNDSFIKTIYELVEL